MKGWPALVAAPAAAALCALPASGQKLTSFPAFSAPLSGPKPARIPDNRHLSEAERGRVTAVAFATCTVFHHRREVREALAMPAFSAESNAIISKMMSRECLETGHLRMANMAARAALYQALYRADFGETQPALLPTPPDFDKPEGNEGDAAILGYMVQFADCVIRENLTQSRAVLLAPTATKSEAEALSGLASSFNGCMPEGTPLHLNKIVVIGALAEALYRESAAAQLELGRKKN